MTPDDTPEFVTFRFTRPVAGAPLDANGNVPTEDVELRVPLSDILPAAASMEPPIGLSLVPDASLLQVYSRSDKLPGNIEGDWLLAEIERRGLTSDV